MQFEQMRSPLQYLASVNLAYPHRLTNTGSKPGAIHQDAVAIAVVLCLPTKPKGRTKAVASLCPTPT